MSQAESESEDRPCIGGPGRAQYVYHAAVSSRAARPVTTVTRTSPSTTRRPSERVRVAAAVVAAAKDRLPAGAGRLSGLVTVWPIRVGNLEATARETIRVGVGAA